MQIKKLSTMHKGVTVEKKKVRVGSGLKHDGYC